MCSDQWEQEQMQDQAKVSARLPKASVCLEIMHYVISSCKFAKHSVKLCLSSQPPVLLHLWEQRKERETLLQTTLTGRSALLHLFHWRMTWSWYDHTSTWDKCTFKLLPKLSVEIAMLHLHCVAHKANFDLFFFFLPPEETFKSCCEEKEVHRGPGH